MRHVARLSQQCVLLVSLLLLPVATSFPAHGADDPASPVVYLPLVAHPAPPDMVLVPAGPFQMGCNPDHDPGCQPYEQPLHTVTLDAYAIDIHEVTNARYAACVAEGGCTPPQSNQAYSRLRSFYTYYGVALYANYPVIYVNWFQAYDFCIWDGKRLPTEAEWERAARGSIDTRIYPWGNATPDCTRLNFFDDPSYCVGETSAVGSFPSGASRDGVRDMSGNVWEWVNDRWQADYYSISPPANPPGPAIGEFRVLRSGSFDYNARFMRAASRVFVEPAYKDHLIGFRCVRSP